MEERHLSEQQMQTIEGAVKTIIEALGDNPNREGLKETPHRVAKMYDEVFAGMRYSNYELATMYDKCFTDCGQYGVDNDIVLMRDIDAFSYCEHHMALMYNMKVHVAYIPCGKVIGISKIARIVDMVSRRLQLQERIASDIKDVLQMILHDADIMVIVEGEHSCMTARGIKKPGTTTKSVSTCGRFSTEQSLREEVYSMLKL